MEYKPSAGIFVGGICLLIGGPLVGFIRTTFGTWAAARGGADGNLTGILIGVVVFGALLGIIGIFMLVAAAYRALVKIDALPVNVRSPRRENWPAD